MTIRAHAKVNLRLRILAPGADNYHSLETIFLRLELADRVEAALRRAPGIALDLALDPSLGGDPVPADERNLAWRAAESLLAESGQPGGATIRLEKRIPAGSGLGGASSNAAAVLRALNAELDRPLADDTLRRLAGELGSDVPFFLLPQGMALGWERGRGLMPLAAPPSRPVLLLVPPFPIGSGDAYAWLDARRGDSAPGPASTLPAAHRLSDWATLRRLATNDFEPAVFDRHPLLAACKEALSAEGAELALLSGSGSTLFGVFATVEERDRAAERLSAVLEVSMLRTATWAGPVDASARSDP